MNESVSELISAYLYGHISPEQYEQLRAWLLADPDHLRRYIHEAYLHRATRLTLQRRQASLEHVCVDADLGPGPSDGPVDLLRTIIERDLEQTESGTHGRKQMTPEQIRQLADLRLEAFLEELRRQRQMEQQAAGAAWDWADVKDHVLQAAGAVGRACAKTAKVAAVALIVALAVATAVLYSRSHRVVATLSDSLQARWSEPLQGPELRPGRLRLEQGYARIVFQKGADVSIEAPAEFCLESAQRMTLYSGQLLAEVPPSAKGFRVDTAQAIVVDLGTQFGVVARPEQTSDLHLFKGQAALTPRNAGRAGRNQTLTEGQAKRVDTTGQVRDIPLQEQTFVRRFRSDTGFVWRGQRLSLVDLVAKGNGLGGGQTNVYVDPIEGYKESIYCSGKGNEYHVLAANAFIDGLFIPDGSKRQIVSSQGHEFADCPQTNGECYATLGANPNQSAWATDMRNGIVQFSGQEYGDQSHPCLVMHANLGITFDLNAIRALCPDMKMSRFVTEFGIADFKEPASCNADFWVLVDGHVRQCRRNVTQKGILSDFSVELRPSDHFLTLVTTDGGDIDRMGSYQRSYTCDWCVFVQPALILETEEGVAF